MMRAPDNLADQREMEFRGNEAELILRQAQDDGREKP
jgi:hypothetical protein